jgi:hypothetical protein
MAHTALSWFFDNLKNHEIQAEHFELYQQAKAMEKEQIIHSFNEGMLNSVEYFGNGFHEAEQYYNETYNK